MTTERELLKQAHEHVCSLLCPSVRKESEQWTHVPLCEAIKHATQECGNCDNSEHCARQYGICLRAERTAHEPPADRPAFLEWCKQNCSAGAESSEWYWQIFQAGARSARTAQPPGDARVKLRNVEIALTALDSHMLDKSGAIEAIRSALTKGGE